MKKIIKGIWPYLLILSLTLVFFFPVFSKGLLPIPSDIIPGIYFPWHEIKYPQYPNGVPVKNNLPSDIVSLTYPLRSLSVDLIKDRQWPLWNSYILSGTPLLANFQSAALYPLNILFLFINNFTDAWSVQVIIQPLLACLFTYLFLRSLGLKKISSLFGSLIWGYGGFISLWMQYNTVIHAVLYLPLTLFAIKKMSRNPVFGALLSVSVLFSLTAGNPPMTMIMMLTAGLFAIFEFGKDIKKYLLALFFVIVGLGLSAPLFLPGLETTNSSIRDIDVVAQSANIKYLPFGKIITMIAPDYYGNPSTANQWSVAGLYDNLTIFIGVVPLLFFLASFIHKTKQNKKFLYFSWFLFFVSLLLAIKNPFSVWLGSQKLLGFSAMVMTRFTVLTSFAVAIASAFTLEELISNRSKLRNWLIPIIIILGFIAEALIISLGINFHFKSIFSGLPYKDIEIYITGSWVAIRNTAIPLVISLVATFSIFLFFVFPQRLPQKAKSLLIVILLLATVYDLYHFFNKYNTFSYREFLYPETAITSELQKLPGRTARENDAVIPSNMWLPYKLKFASGYDTLFSLRYDQFLSILNSEKIKNTASRYAEVENIENKLFDFLGIQNIVVTKRFEGVPSEKGEVPHPYNTKKFTKVFESGAMAILNNPDAMPMIFPVESFVVATNSSSLENLLLSTDLGKTVVFEDNPDFVVGKNLPKINSLNISDQKITLSTSGSELGLLVTSQTYNSGWKLTIDGKKSEIIIANHAFISFVVPEGEHSVLLQYLPDSFIKGLWVFLISIISLLVSMAVNGYSGSKRSPIRQ